MIRRDLFKWTGLAFLSQGISTPRPFTPHPVTPPPAVDPPLFELSDRQNNLSTGFAKLDVELGGFRRGHIHSITGLPASGKSSFAHHVVKANPQERWLICQSPTNHTLLFDQIRRRKTTAVLIDTIDFLSQDRRAVHHILMQLSVLSNTLSIPMLCLSNLKVRVGIYEPPLLLSFVAATCLQIEDRRQVFVRKNRYGSTGQRIAI